MEIATKNQAHFLLVLTLIVFISMAFFGMPHAMGMEQRSDGTMGSCFFIGMDEICTMTFTTHLTQWQDMFTSIPAKSSILSLTLLALAIGLISLASAYRKQYFMWAAERLQTLYKLYLTHNSNLSPFNPLQEAFSNGILHPKIF